MKELKNIDRPFAELFALLTMGKNFPIGIRMYEHSSDELQQVHQHVENATDILLQGLQDVCLLLRTAGKKDTMISDMSNVSFFISSVVNLVEALCTLRINTEHVLMERGIVNY